ncbi:MAG TPA: HD domain-containing phosphohydrolase, partial [Blastocatellia bacterium]|nr:HD domain-containing phosphohydrolase [Blastocatellia bacterium]
MESFLIWWLLALLLCLTTARYPLQLPGTYCSVSISEVVLFLGVILLGPHHGALLVAVDTLAASARLKLKPSLYVFNTANQTLSIFVAGNLYYKLSHYLKAQPAGGLGQKMLAFALPVIVLALAHYLLHMVVVSLMSHLRHGAKLTDWARATLPWEPVTYVAGATVAGLIHLAFREYGAIATLVTVILAAPIPVIIYYTFKTYHEKLREQDRHYKELTGVYDSVLEMLAMAIQAKDEMTHDHLQRVKLFATRVGEKIGLSKEELEALRAGALLHDIGKIGVPAYILNKPGKLTEYEYEQVKMHPVIGADMLSNINFRYPVVPIVRHHHERWDGGGYPDGLKGEEIPLTARILALVDDYDTLRLGRPYKKARGREEALDYLRENAGVIFDPKLVEVFLPMIGRLEAEAAELNITGRAERNKAEGVSPAASPGSPFAAPPQRNRAIAALHSIAETNQRVSALYEMTRTLASIMSVEDMMAILADRLSRLIPFTTCAISLYDAARSEFETVQALGRHAEKFHRRRQPVNSGITGWVIQNQRPMYNTNPAFDLDFLDA